MSKLQKMIQPLYNLVSKATLPYLMIGIVLFPVIESSLVQIPGSPAACRSMLEQDTEPNIAPDVHLVNVTSVIFCYS